MGVGYFAQCLRCNNSFNFIKGGGFAYYQMICDCCGFINSAPRYKPYTNVKSMTEFEIKSYLINKKLWVKDGLRFSSKELKILNKLLGKCSCGGVMLPEWDKDVKYRCPTCRSYEFKILGGDITFD